MIENDDWDTDWLESVGFEYDDEMQCWVKMLPKNNGKIYPLMYFHDDTWQVGTVNLGVRDKRSEVVCLCRAMQVELQST